MNSNKGIPIGESN